MKTKLENLVILLLFGLVGLYLLGSSDLFLSILNPFIRNAHFLLVLYVLIVYLNDALKFLGRKVQRLFYPHYVKIRRSFKRLFR